MLTCRSSLHPTISILLQAIELEARQEECRGDLAQTCDLVYWLFETAWLVDCREYGQK